VAGCIDGSRRDTGGPLVALSPASLLAVAGQEGLQGVSWPRADVRVSSKRGAAAVDVNIALNQTISEVDL
jgi:hypothetical protein